MNYSEIKDFINRIEKKYPVSEWTIDGIHVWPIIRGQINIRMMPNKVSNVNSIDKYVVDSNNQYSIVSKFNKISIKNKEKWLENLSDVIILGEASTRVFMNGVWCDKFFDPIVDELNNMGLKVTYLERTLKNIYYIPTSKSTIKIQEHLDYFNKNVYFNNSIKRYMPQFEEFKKELNNFIKLNGLNGYYIQNVMKYLDHMVFRIKYAKNYFKFIFAKIRPIVGIMSIFHNIFSFAFSLACFECGIPSVEIQHGFINKKHWLYDGWNNIPKYGYEILPTYFWCWNDEGVDTINAWSCRTRYHKAIKGGYPYFYMNKKNSKSLSSCVEKKDRMNLEEKEYINILFSHQEGLGIPNYLIEAINKSPDNWRWHIRIHPRTIPMKKNEIKNLLDQYNKLNIEYEKATSMPLLDLLNNIDVHVTMGSSVVSEAEALGIPSVVTDEVGIFEYDDKIKLGLCVQAYNSDEIIHGILYQLKNREKLKFNNKLTEINIRESLEIIIKDARLKKQKYLSIDFLGNISEFKISDIENRMILEQYIQILFMEEEYDSIIKSYKDYDLPKVLYYVGKSYQAKGQLQDCVDYLKRYIDKVNSDTYSQNLIVESKVFIIKANCELIELLIELNDNHYTSYWNEAYKKCKEDAEIREPLLQGFYVKKQYNRILLFKEIDSVDVNYYVGKTYKSLSDYNRAVFYFSRYINRVNKKLYKKGSSYVLSDEAIISVYYHLGEILFVQKNIKCKKCFERCVELSRERHKKAEEYLMKISQMW